jgi:hypothetical protein
MQVFKNANSAIAIYLVQAKCKANEHILRAVVAGATDKLQDFQRKAFLIILMFIPWQL